MLFVEVVYWEVNWSYSSLLVVLAHQRPVRASMVDVDLRLNIEYARDASFLHGLRVLFKLRVRTDEYIGVAYFVEGEPADEVGISHFHVTVDDESLLDVAPDI